MTIRIDTHAELCLVVNVPPIVTIEYTQVIGKTEMPMSLKVDLTNVSEDRQWRYLKMAVDSARFRDFLINDSPSVFTKISKKSKSKQFLKKILNVIRTNIGSTKK